MCVLQDCCICCDGLREASGYSSPDDHVVVQLYKCSHMFHLDCLAAMYDSGTRVRHILSHALFIATLSELRSILVVVVVVVDDALPT